MLRKGRGFIWEPADQEDGRLAPQNDHLVGPGCQVFCFFFFKGLDLGGGEPWVFFGKNDAKAETPVLWLPHAKS